MVPISQALQVGGIQAAYARYAELKADGTDGSRFDANDLVNLAGDSTGVGQEDRAGSGGVGAKPPGIP
jgi:hypothetical protein